MSTSNDSVTELFQKLGSGEFLAWTTRVEGLWKARNTEYLARIGVVEESGQRHIKDAVHGMIGLSPQESAVIDSPLLQRLRMIRQLGVSYLTYPTANHTRFEHTIGVMHQAERMYELVCAQSNRPVDLKHLNLIRLAAMLHDIGHLPFSHVTERFYSRKECTNPSLLSNIRKVGSQLQKLLLVPEPSLSEILSACVICTPGFRAILKKCGYKDADVAKACLVILGHPLLPEIAFIRQIITSVVDADKLDYMVRDAQMTSVPPAADLARLVHKLHLREVPVDGLPIRRIFPRASSALVLATDISGENQIKDVVLGRTLLYQRVYLHHKTRAAERMVLTELRSRNVHPVTLLASDDSYFFDSKSRTTARVLKERHLPSRQYAFTDQAESLKMNRAEHTGESTSTGEPLVKKFAKLDDPNFREDLQGLVYTQFREILRVTGKLQEFDKLTRPPGGAWFLLDSQLNFQSPPLDLLAFAPDDTLLSNLFPKTAPAFTQYSFGTFYIYSYLPADYRTAGFVACEIVVFDKVQLKLGRGAADYAKIKWNAAETIKRSLAQAQADIWDLDKRWAIRPTVDFSNHAILAKIEQLAQKFGDYSAGIRPINATELKRFAAQFPEDLIPTLLDLLDEIKYLSRADFEQAGDQFSNTGTSVFTALSTRGNESGHAMPYFLFRGDANPAQCVSLEEAIKAVKKGKPLSIIDDWTLSGKQARTGLQTMFGLKPDLPEEAAHFKRLSDDELIQIRNVGINYYFVAAKSDALTSIEALGKDLGAKVTAQCQYDLSPHTLDAWIKRAKGDERKRRTRLKRFLAKVGERLLKTTKQKENPVKWDDNRCKRDALGYGSTGLLAASWLDAPTSTITALWRDLGTIGEEPWFALFRRNHGEHSSRY